MPCHAFRCLVVSWMYVPGQHRKGLMGKFAWIIQFVWFVLGQLWNPPHTHTDLASIPVTISDSMAKMLNWQEFYSTQAAKAKDPPVPPRRFSLSLVPRMIFCIQTFRLYVQLPFSWHRGPALLRQCIFIAGGGKKISGSKRHKKKVQGNVSSISCCVDPKRGNDHVLAKKQTRTLGNKQ